MSNCEHCQAPSQELIGGGERWDCGSWKMNNGNFRSVECRDRQIKLVKERLSDLIMRCQIIADNTYIPDDPKLREKLLFAIEKARGA